ncbi:hypothetical protein IQ07DRAFT_32571 [Pyrenochaeta sp. DS3sAY3a]|nr:hypothetical protein IQ07DRAFT_32571 [Pyrenochaeta sp. DS3sAY3a]
MHRELHLARSSSFTVYCGAGIPFSFPTFTFTFDIIFFHARFRSGSDSYSNRFTSVNDVVLQFQPHR